MNLPVRKLNRIFLVLILFVILYIFGAFHHIFESDFYENFHYPYDGDLEPLVDQLKNNLTPSLKPINVYNFKFVKPCNLKCDIHKLRLVYIIKSDLENFNRRTTIRRTWGYEKRFSDVEIRTVFLIGQRDSLELQKSLDIENNQYADLVQANFTDSYYNNTYKTMMGMQWAVKYCPNSEYYMFVDDDYYVSTKNVLRFLRHPTNYPEYVKTHFLAKRDIESFQDNYRLYAGYVFQSSPHRHLMSKWYISLKEYPYHKWPPYVTAGAYVLSRSALIDMYYSSFYTKHFRFDDIYMGLLAYKANIQPVHCGEFYFHKKQYNKFNFKYVVASHGYGNPDELLNMWLEQKSLGNA